MQLKSFYVLAATGLLLSGCSNARGVPHMEYNPVGPYRYGYKCTE